MNKLISVLAALALVFVASISSYGADAYNAELEGTPNGGTTFLLREDASFQAWSTLSGTENSSIPDQNSWACNGADDPECKPTSSKYSVGGYAILPVCDKDRINDCVENLELASVNGQFEKATFVRNATGQIFKPVPSVGYIGGSTASIFDAKNAPSASGETTYSVVVQVQTHRNGFGKYLIHGFTAAVAPTRIQSGDYKDPVQKTYEFDPPRGNKTLGFGGSGNDGTCFWNESGNCAIVQDFSEGTKVRLTVRISNKIGGWFSGRLKSPTMSVAKYSDSNNKVIVEGEPVSVPRLSYVLTDNKKASEKEKFFLEENGGGGGKSWSPVSQPHTFDYVDYFRPMLNDTASGVNTFWNFGASQTESTSNRCLADKSKILGLVTTNSMVYDGGVPKFAKGYLNYKVAGLHYAPGGQDLNLGVYDLIMRSETAQCLYGFTKAPLSATVSVVNEKGTKTTATTVVSEKNGWLKMAAYGFTFSKKTIKVKITKKKK